MKKRNSLIEFYRFIFAMNVVKNHGYFPYQGSYFSPGRISVEFFFVLSGLFLRKSIDKYMNLPFWKGLLFMLKDKLLSLGIPLLIGLLVNIPYNFVTGVQSFWDFNIWGYLWYVSDMLLVYIFYFIIRRFVKNEKRFFAIAAIVFFVTAVIHIVPQFYAWGYFRAFSTMSLGILISYIPPIKIKKQWLLCIPLIFVWAYVLRMLLFDFTFIEEEILNLVAYPALIYLTFQLPVHNKVLNYVGALSFGLYAYQSVPRLLRVLNIGNIWIYFLIIIGLTVLTDGIMRIIRYQKKKKQQEQVA